MTCKDLIDRFIFESNFGSRHQISGSENLEFSYHEYERDNNAYFHVVAKKTDGSLRSIVLRYVSSPYGLTESEKEANRRDLIVGSLLTLTSLGLDRIKALEDSIPAESLLSDVTERDISSRISKVQNDNRILEIMMVNHSSPKSPIWVENREIRRGDVLQLENGDYVKVESMAHMYVDQNSNHTSSPSANGVNNTPVSGCFLEGINHEFDHQFIQPGRKVKLVYLKSKQGNLLEVE